MSLQQITLPKAMSKLSNKDSNKSSEVINDITTKNKNNPQGDLMTTLLFWVKITYFVVP